MITTFIYCFEFEISEDNTIFETGINKNMKISVLKVISYYLSQISSYLVYFSIIFRLWHLAFDLRWNIHSKDESWKRHINKTKFDSNFWFLFLY